MSVTTKLVGTITDIFGAEIHGSFEKRIVWLKELDQQARYPEHWAIEFWQGDVNLTEGFKVGQDVIATVDIKGRFWEKGGREGVIITLKCFKLEKVATSTTQTATRTTAPAPKAPASTRPAAPAPKLPGGQSLSEPLDDLPF